LGSIQEDNIKAARLSKLLTPTLQDWEYSKVMPVISAT
jgi:hypothetical protein